MISRTSDTADAIEDAALTISRARVTLTTAAIEFAAFDWTNADLARSFGLRAESVIRQVAENLGEALDQLDAIVGKRTDR